MKSKISNDALVAQLAELRKEELTALSKVKKEQGILQYLRDLAKVRYDYHRKRKELRQNCYLHIVA